MRYFAYGSNMSCRRIQARIPCARPITTAHLAGHDLRFHKAGDDDSGKCDAYFTGNPDDIVWGVIFEIAPEEKYILDQFEGLGNGYLIKQVSLQTDARDTIDAFTYYATHLDDTLLPYCWYHQHVLIGAREARLPEAYIQRIEQTPFIPDPDKLRRQSQVRIYSLAHQPH